MWPRVCQWKRWLDFWFQISRTSKYYVFKLDGWVWNFCRRLYYQRMISRISDTRGTINILSLIMKSSNLSSKLTFLVFKVFCFMIYTLLHVFEHFLSICLYQSTLASSWPFVKLFGMQREQIFFTAKCSWNILYILVERMPKVAQH